MSETSTKPYLLRAIYEWCTDNGFTPYLAVLVDAHTRVPMQFVKNGEIVLNISFDATSALKMDNDRIHFSARFGGVSREISVPVENVIAIYARENGQGMAFDVPHSPARDAGNADQEGSQPMTEKGNEPKAAPGLMSVPATTTTTTTTTTTEKIKDAAPEDDPEPPKKGGRPTLTRIK